MMAFEPFRLVGSHILQLKPYQPGKPIEECQREFGITDFIKLASNENPLGTSPHIIQNWMSISQELARYPDGNAYALKEALSARLHILPSQLMLGNGSEDVLRMLLQTFISQDYHVIVPEYAFIAYKILSQGLGISMKEIPAVHFGTDLDAILAAIDSKTRMVLFANPNNPTGTYVTESALRAFLAKVPDNVIVVCDEAYYEYAIQKDYPQTLPIQKHYPNLVITRTFSKAYGLAGLRLGYGIAHPEIVELVNRVRQPFNVNVLAQRAGCLALEDQAFIQKSIRVNEEGKQQLYQGLSKLGLKYFPSAGNFVMVQISVQDKDIFDNLLRRGVIIRPLGPYQLKDFFRITIGLEEENRRCLTALAEIL